MRSSGTMRRLWRFPELWFGGCVRRTALPAGKYAARPGLTGPGNLGGRVPMVKEGQVIGAIVLYRTRCASSMSSKSHCCRASPIKLSSPSRMRELLEELQTRQRELETRTQELEIASRHKSQFVANMSHE